ncbi:MAG: hypothetical protein V4517_04385 [Pseudomonadota bacterium]
MKHNGRSTMTGRQKAKNPKKLKKQHVAGANLAQRYMELQRLRATLFNVEASRTNQ